MPDRTKVIKTLEVCVLLDDCRTCEYWIKRVDHDCQIMKDALSLLKEQQDEIYALQVEVASAKEYAEGCAELLKEQERKKGSWDYGTQCSVCKGTIIPPKDRKVRVNFCPWCGADISTKEIGTADNAYRND